MNITDDLKTEILRLRQTKSIREVAKLTGVSRTSVGQISVKIPNPDLRNAKFEQWKLEAKELYSIHKNNPLFNLGIGLYWGEGSKRGNKLTLCNSDYRVIVKWKKWCTTFIPNVNLKGAVYLHAPNDPKEAIQFWAYCLGLDPKQILCHVLQNRTTSSKKPTRLISNGVFHLKVGVGSLEWLTKMLALLDIMDGD